MRQNRWIGWSRGVTVALVLLSFTFTSLAMPRQASAAIRTVGDGTLGSCDEAAFGAELLAAVDNDIIEFNCDAADMPIVFTDWKTIDITLTIDGGNSVILSGGDRTGFFYVDPAGELTLQNIVLTDGRSDGSLGSLYAGAVEVDGSFTLDNSTISSSTAEDDDGGAISNYGYLTITRSTLADNDSAFYGGAIYNIGDADISETTIIGNDADVGGGISNDGSLTMRDSAVLDNTAISAIGGIENFGTADLFDSTIAGNAAPLYGGVFNIGLFEADGITISGNTADYDAGFINAGGADIRNSTISGNHAVEGAIIVNSISCGCGPRIASKLGAASLTDRPAKTGKSIQPAVAVDPYIGVVADLDIVDSTIAANTAVHPDGVAIYNSDDLSLKGVLVTNPALVANCDNDGRLTSGGYNLITDASCAVSRPTDLINVAAGIEPLASNGGLTQTHALQATSLAVDSNAFCGATDQRGESRAQGNSCDIGAYESAFFRDIDGPTTTAPTIEFTATGILQNISAIDIAWTGADEGGSDIASYELQRRVGIGAWHTLSTVVTSDLSVDVTRWFTRNRTYDLRVRATDGAGNVGDWSAVTTFTLTVIEDSDASITYAAPADWRVRRLPYVSGLSMHSSAQTGATATLVDFTGDSIAWIGSRSATGGTALVRVDSQPWTFVDLSAVSAAHRRTLFSVDGLSAVPHTLTIRTLDALAVTVDAFVILDQP